MLWRIKTDKMSKLAALAQEHAVPYPMYIFIKHVYIQFQ
jgi:hypothetical protein